jgi:hypothetical protein
VAASHAAGEGVTDYLSVVDRSTGAVLAETANAGQQVASESIMKLFLATYYLLLYGGYTHTPADVRDRLSYMLRYSDDATASALFTSSAIPTVAARYGLTATTNATDRPGHWGAARITAHDMTRFLYRASRDAEVGPWLLPVMAATAPHGSDGFDQDYGLNALTGTHGSKQGWGIDSFWTAQHSAIHSVGYTDKYLVAVLQLSTSYPDPARDTATFSAKTIQAAVPGPPPDGTFVRRKGSAAVYRLVGGAPVYVSSWAPFAGSQPVRTLTPATWDMLRQVPADGTFIRAGGSTYRIAGGAPLRVSSWATVGGYRPATVIDPAAVSHAGRTGVWSHLRQMPADGTFISAGGPVYRVVGGAPVYVSSWAAVGGHQHPTVVDPAAVNLAGRGGVWDHLRQQPADGTFIRAGGSTYRFAGGAPLRVSSWATVGGYRPATVIDPAALSHAGRGGVWDHVRQHPADGTFIAAGGHIYRVAGGAPLYVTSWAPLGGSHPSTTVDPAAVNNAGQPGVWSHLRQLPADGTFLVGRPGGKVYRVRDGVARYVSSWQPYGGPQPTVAITQTTINRAGSGGVYDHLRHG